MNGKLCVPDRLASTIVNWWHKWETYHSHGAKLWKSIKHRLFGARLYTRKAGDNGGAQEKKRRKRKK